MTNEIRAIVEQELFCACGKCEEAVQDILRMERMLCHGARATLSKRRAEIKRVHRRVERREYFRRRYAAAREE